jgi:NAD(P)H-flavin reductase
MAGATLEPMLPRPYRLDRVARETHDTFTLGLSPVADAAPLVFSPGQFNMLYAFGVGEVPISLSGDPVRPEAVVHTIRDVGAVTHALCHAAPGTVIGLRGPFGTAWPIAAAAGCDAVFVAGGIGLAPLRPALYHVLGHRRDYGRVALLVGARTPEDLLFTEELRAWAAALQVEVTVDSAGAGWNGQVGVVTRLIRRAAFAPERTRAFLCGPEIMMRYAVDGLLAAGVPGPEIFVSLERNMKCAIGFCGHCQLGTELLCKSGPVYPYPRVAPLWTVKEL